MKQENLIYGFHAINRLIEIKPYQLLEIYVLSGRDDQRVSTILSWAEREGISVQRVTKKQLDQWLSQENHQGIAAKIRPSELLSEPELYGLLEFVTEKPLILILDGIQDPHNLGACLRTADAVGAHAVVIPKDGSVALTPTVRKVASGAAETVPVVQVTNLTRCLEKLKERGIWLMGTSAVAPQSLFQTDLRGAVGIILGAEGSGMRRLTTEHCDVLMHIPMAGMVESLNVSVAAGVCLFEAKRQRIL